MDARFDHSPKRSGFGQMSWSVIQMTYGERAHDEQHGPDYYIPHRHFACEDAQIELLSGTRCCGVRVRPVAVDYQFTTVRRIFLMTRS
jgi:hypothetical protein